MEDIDFYKYGLPNRVGTLAMAPPVLRHYTFPDFMDGIIKHGQLVAGTMYFAENINHNPRVRNYFPDVLGLFFTTPECNASSVGASGSHRDSFVDVELPGSTVLVELRTMNSGKIYVMMGPPGIPIGTRTTRTAANLSYQPLTVPVNIVGSSAIPSLEIPGGLPSPIEVKGISNAVKAVKKVERVIERIDIKK